MRVALATAIAAWDEDIDLPPLLAACERAGLSAQALAWDDPTVSWSRFDAVLLRSTWDYTQRLPEFLGWCERVESCTRLFNSAATVRWNTDKRYLAELAGLGVPIVPTTFIEAESDLVGIAAQKGEFVLKPSVGAGSRHAARFAPAQRAGAEAHARALLAQGFCVMLQPYLDGVDQHGETALIHIAGRYTHAIRKGPLLSPGGQASDALFAAEDIQPRIATDAEHAVAEQVIAGLPDTPLYARVDLLPTAQGPRLLELELVEPSLFFATSHDAADRLVSALLERLKD
jgi:glutathione synthase/RimK-type ligase-like ATP-grasp enzyme